MRGSTLSLILLVSVLTGCELIGSDEGNRNGTCGQHSSCPFDQACGGGNCVDLLNRSFVVSQVAVSYTHLTLPTIYSV